jgi:hypothetical protein
LLRSRRTSSPKGVGGRAVQFGEAAGDVVAGGVDDGVGTDGEGRLQALGDDVGDGHVRDPAQLQPDGGTQADGPAPKTTTLSVGLAWERLTQWRATAMGSLRAATSKGTVSGKTATLLPTTASSISR